MRLSSGLPARHKGLHLVVRAMVQMAAQSTEESAQLRAAATRYVQSISAEAFRAALVSTYTA